MNLRQYQIDCVDSIYRYFERHEGNPLLVLPTAAGKSVVQAAFIARALGDYADERFLLVSHVRELLQQNRDKLEKLCPDVSIGYYCAGLGEKRTDCQITLASIQSVYKSAEDFQDVGLVIVDEAHLVPKRSAGRYHEFFTRLREANPRIKVIGMSATPYRMESGLLHRGEGALFTDICFEVGVLPLIEQGYLCKMVSKCTGIRADLSGVHIRGGEYVESELQKACMEGDIIERSCLDLKRRTEDRKKILVFCVGIDHASAVTKELNNIGIESEIVTGQTPAGKRAEILEKFKAGEIRALCNVNVLTTGFDAPDIDAIAMLRPTKSTGLYYQMVGRGFRIAESKKDCLICDYAGNVLEHGPVSEIDIDWGSGESVIKKNTYKVCPECESPVKIAERLCEECGYVFPQKEKHITHSVAPNEAPIVVYKTSSLPSEETLTVDSVRYSIHRKPDKPPSLKVSYQCGLITYDKYVCMFHEGYAGEKARKWWDNHYIKDDGSYPSDAEEMLMLTERLYTPTRILVKFGGTFPEITRFEIKRKDGWLVWVR